MNEINYTIFSNLYSGFLSLKMVITFKFSKIKVLSCQFNNILQEYNLNQNCKIDKIELSQRILL